MTRRQMRGQGHAAKGDPLAILENAIDLPRTRAVRLSISTQIWDDVSPAQQDAIVVLPHLLGRRHAVENRAKDRVASDQRQPAVYNGRISVRTVFRNTGIEPVMHRIA